MGFEKEISDKRREATFSLTFQGRVCIWPVTGSLRAKFLARSSILLNFISSLINNFLLLASSFLYQWLFYKCNKDASFRAKIGIYRKKVFYIGSGTDLYHYRYPKICFICFDLRFSTFFNFHGTLKELKKIIGGTLTYYKMTIWGT